MLYVAKSNSDLLDNIKRPSRDITALKERIARRHKASPAEQERLLRFYGVRNAEKLQNWLVGKGVHIRDIIAGIKRDPGQSQPRRSALAAARLGRRSW